MTNTRLLNEAIQRSGLKKVFIAEKVGLSPVGLHNCITGKSEFKQSQISVICDLLGIKDLEQKEAIFFAEFVESYSTQ